MYRWVIAWRWLKNLPILWVSVVGVLLGVASILVVDSIFNGVLRELKRVYRGSSSDIVVFTQLPPRGGQVNPAPTEALLAAIRGVEGVEGAAPRLRRPCILPKEMKLPEVIAIGAISRQSLLEVCGIVPKDEATVGDFRRYLERAPPARRVDDFDDPFSARDLPQGTSGAVPILIGDRCAQALKLERGSTFELLTLGDVDPQNAREAGVHPRSQRFVVAGTFVTESFIEDLQRAYVELDELRTFAATASTSTEIAVKARPDADLEALREALLLRLGPYQLNSLLDQPVRLWKEIESRTLAAIDNQRRVLDFVLFFIVLVAGFNLLVSLHLLVTEKLRDIGTLASMGGGAFGIASIFTTLGLLVTGVGATLGLASGFLLAHNINPVHDTLAGWLGRRLWESDVYIFERIPVAFEPAVIGIALVGTFGVTLLFAFLASLRAARLDPVVALRHE